MYEQIVFFFPVHLFNSCKLLDFHSDLLKVKHIKNQCGLKTINPILTYHLTKTMIQKQAFQHMYWNFQLRKWFFHDCIHPVKSIRLELVESVKTAICHLHYDNIFCKINCKAKLLELLALVNFSLFTLWWFYLLYLQFFHALFKSLPVYLHSVLLCFERRFR